MIGVLCFVLAVLALPFKSKLRLQAENAMLRHQLIVLRRRQISACAANAPGSSLGFWRRSGDKAAGVIVLIGGKKRATNWMNLPQLRRAVWLRRLSDASQSRFTLLKNHHRLGWLPQTAKEVRC